MNANNSFFTFPVRLGTCAPPLADKLTYCKPLRLPWARFFFRFIPIQGQYGWVGTTWWGKSHTKAGTMERTGLSRKQFRARRLVSVGHHSSISFIISFCGHHHHHHHHYYTILCPRKPWTPWPGLKRAAFRRVLPRSTRRVACPSLHCC